MISDDTLRTRIRSLLGSLYLQRLTALERITLGTLLANSPSFEYALGIAKPSDFILQLLIAQTCSFDETFVPKELIDPLASFAANTHPALSSEGCSITPGAAIGQYIHSLSAPKHLAIAVNTGLKSDHNNSTEFEQVQAQRQELGMMFRHIIGYGYAREAPIEAPASVGLAAQKFWAGLTGDDTFYLRITRSMASCADEHRSFYSRVFAQKHRALLRDFMLEFVTPNGDTNWNAVLAVRSTAQSKNCHPLPV